MKLALYFLALLGAVLVHSEESPAKFTVDLAKEPSERWNGALKVALAKHSWENGFQKTFEHHNKTLFDKLKDRHWRLMAEAIEDHYPDYALELKSIAAQFQEEGHYVSFEYLAGWVYYHELSHSNMMTGAVGRECAAAVAVGTDGRTLFGGNMDQSPHQVRNVTLQIDFIRGLNEDGSPNLVFRGVDWYWFTGGVTRAVRKGVATLQENWRTGEILEFDDVMDMISNGVISQDWVFREVLSQEPPLEWSALVQHLRTVPLASPFFIVATGAGPYQAVAISRTLTGEVEYVELDKSNQEGWTLAQANTDRSVGTEQNDPRRFSAEYIMRDLGQEEASTEVGMMTVVSSFPTYNPNTAYTVVMRAETGALHAYVRAPMCPQRGYKINKFMQSSSYCNNDGPVSPYAALFNQYRRWLRPLA